MHSVARTAYSDKRSERSEDVVVEYSWMCLHQKFADAGAFALARISKVARVSKCVCQSRSIKSR